MKTINDFIARARALIYSCLKEISYTLNNRFNRRNLSKHAFRISQFRLALQAASYRILELALLGRAFTYITLLVLVGGFLSARAQSDVSNVIQPGDLIIASSTNSPAAEGVANAIDGLPSTKYLNFDSGRDGTNAGFSPSGFVVTPSVGVTLVTGIKMQSANDEEGRDPKAITLEGSNDDTISSFGSGNWTLITTISDIPAFTERFQKQTFSFTNLVAYKHYRWTVTETATTNNGCCMQIAEVELLGKIPVEITVSSVERRSEVQSLRWGTSVLTVTNFVAVAKINPTSSALFPSWVTFLGAGSATFIQTQVNSTNVWLPSSTDSTIFGFRILSLPEDQIAPTNGQATFMIQAEPINTNDVITYQWIKNDATPIDGATSANLDLTNVSTNVDVAFYSCDLRVVSVVEGKTNFFPLYRARSKDSDAPGARLFVYAGTNTPCTGPYQPAYPGSRATCPGFSFTYIGSVQFRNPEPGPLYGSTYFARPQNSSSYSAIDRTSGPPGYSSIVYARETSALPPNCGFGSVSGSANPPPKYYQFTIYVISGATGGITLDVSW